MKTEEWPLVNYSLELLMERRMRGNSHVRCERGENSEITSKNYLSAKLFQSSHGRLERSFRRYGNSHERKR